MKKLKSVFELTEKEVSKMSYMQIKQACMEALKQYPDECLDSFFDELWYYSNIPRDVIKELEEDEEINGKIEEDKSSYYKEEIKGKIDNSCNFKYLYFVVGICVVGIPKIGDILYIIKSNTKLDKQDALDFLEQQGIKPHAYGVGYYSTDFWGNIRVYEIKKFSADELDFINLCLEEKSEEIKIFEYGLS